MFWKSKTLVTRDIRILENIKQDIKSKLCEMGVVRSSINIDMDSKNISLKVCFQCLPPAAQLVRESEQQESKGV